MFLNAANGRITVRATPAFAISGLQRAGAAASLYMDVGGGSRGVVRDAGTRQQTVQTIGNAGVGIRAKNTAEERPEPPQRKIISSADEIHFLRGARDKTLRRFWTVFATDRKHLTTRKFRLHQEQSGRDTEEPASGGTSAMQERGRKKNATALHREGQPRRTNKLKICRKRVSVRRHVAASWFQARARASCCQFTNLSFFQHLFPKKS